MNMPMVDVTGLLRFAGVAFLLGFVALFFKKFDVGKEISDLVMLAGYVYMLVFIVQLIEVFMTSLRTIFML